MSASPFLPDHQAGCHSLHSAGSAGHGDFNVERGTLIILTCDLPRQAIQEHFGADAVLKVELGRLGALGAWVSRPRLGSWV